MRRKFGTKASVGFGTALALVLGVESAEATQTQRETFSVRGGVQVIGSTMGFDCGSGLTPPAGTSVECTGELPPFADDSAPDVYWRDNEASAFILANDARTSATLDIPEGSTIKFARIYWGARTAAPLADGDIIVDRTGTGGGQVLTADRQDVVTLEGVEGFEHYYQSSAPITQVAQALGAGEFRVSNIDAALFPNVSRDVLYAGWALVVVYENPTAPLTHVTLFDGLDELAPDATPAVTQQDAQLAFRAAKTLTHKTWLTVLGYEGDEKQKGDQLSVNGTPIQNDLNPLGNFFNSTRSSGTLGASPSAVPVVGASDAPPLPGTPGSMASYDLDRVEISQLVSVDEAGQSSALVSVTSSEDNLLVGAYVVEARGCTKATEAIDCGPGGVCDEATGDCVPTTCDRDCPEGSECLLDPNGVPYCTCDEDSDCGAADSCQVCDVEGELGLGERRCVEGCRGTGGNGAPAGVECTSTSEAIGQCGACESDADCPPNAPECCNGVCGCTGNSDCPDGTFCGCVDPACAASGQGEPGVPVCGEDQASRCRALVLEGGGFDANCAMGSGPGSKGLAFAAGALGLATMLRMRRRRR